MKRPVLLTGALVALAATFLACVDLFHDTDPLVQSGGPGAATSSGQTPPDGATPIPLCDPNAGVALEHAKAACAWLGACAAPFGVNEPGACLLQAMRAYDCSFDRANAPRAERAAFWECMHTAAASKSCLEVQKCAFGGPVAPCDQRARDEFLCVSEDGGPGRFTRVLCRTSAVAVPVGGVESCAAAGGTCDPQTKKCSTVPTLDVTAPCTQSACNGSELTICDLDAGHELARFDCTQSGTGQCRSGTDAGPGCVATNVVAADGCRPDQPVSCLQGNAQRCRNEAYEEVRCGNAGLDCDPTGVDLTYEACRTRGDAGACEPGCDANGNVRACLNGRTITLECAANGLGACASNDAPGETGYACGLPR